MWELPEYKQTTNQTSYIYYNSIRIRLFCFVQGDEESFVQILHLIMNENISGKNYTSVVELMVMMVHFIVPLGFFSNKLQ